MSSQQMHQVHSVHHNQKLYALLGTLCNLAWGTADSYCTKCIMTQQMSFLISHPTSQRNAEGNAMGITRFMTIIEVSMTT